MSSFLVSAFLILGIVEHSGVGGQANDYTGCLFPKDIGELRNGIESFSV